MKSFRCNKLNTEDINSVLLELNKAFKEQSKRNYASLKNMATQYELLKQFDEKLDTQITNLVYYKTYFEKICEANDL